MRGSTTCAAGPSAPCSIPIPAAASKASAARGLQLGEEIRKGGAHGKTRLPAEMLLGGGDIERRGFRFRQLARRDLVSERGEQRLHRGQHFIEGRDHAV